MNAKSAYEKLCKKVPGAKALVCRDYENAYGFFIAPDKAVGKQFVGGSMLMVDKETGKVFDQREPTYKFNKPYELVPLEEIYGGQEEVKDLAKAEDFLSHYGIKGQKWGIRRFQNYDGTLINPKGGQSKKSHYEYNSKTGSYKTEDSRSLSDDELRDRNKRLNAENNYVKALRENRENNKTRSQKFAEKLLDKVSDTAWKVIGDSIKNNTTNFLQDRFPGLMGGSQNPKKPKP